MYKVSENLHVAVQFPYATVQKRNQATGACKQTESLSKLRWTALPHAVSNEETEQLKESSVTVDIPQFRKRQKVNACKQTESLTKLRLTALPHAVSKEP